MYVLYTVCKFYTISLIWENSSSSI